MRAFPSDRGRSAGRPAAWPAADPARAAATCASYLTRWPGVRRACWAGVAGRGRLGRTAGRRRVDGELARREVGARVVERAGQPGRGLDADDDRDQRGQGDGRQRRAGPRPGTGTGRAARGAPRSGRPGRARRPLRGSPGASMITATASEQDGAAADLLQCLAAAAFASVPAADPASPSRMKAITPSASPIGTTSPAGLLRRRRAGPPAPPRSAPGRSSAPGARRRSRWPGWRGPSTR